jgi:hypothetical protein
MPLVFRTDLRELLESWQLGLTNAKDVHTWAELRYAVDEWKPEDTVVNELVACLDTLDMNLITPDDVPVFLAALKIPLGRSVEAINAMNRHLESIDIKSRKAALRDDPLYAPFCV